MIYPGYISVLTEPGTRACCRESIWGGDPEEVGAGAQKMLKGKDGKLFQGLVTKLVTLWVTGDYSSWELFGEIVHHVSQNCSRHLEMAFIHPSLFGQGLPCGVNSLALPGLFLHCNGCESSLYPVANRKAPRGEAELR